MTMLDTGRAAEALPLSNTLITPDQLTAARVQPLLEHVAGYVPRLIFDPTTVAPDYHNKLIIPLKHPFMVPSNETQDGFSYEGQQFGWDSYFNARALMHLDPKGYFDVVNGMLENALDMYEEFGINPNSSMYPRLGHAQPPLLTSYVFDMYRTYSKIYPNFINQEWLSKKIATVKREYETVWMGTKDPHNRLTHTGLSRYYDIDLTDDHIQAEGGWDYTPRYGATQDDSSLYYCPADLNAMLYKYERDFAREAQMRGDRKEERMWLHRADNRRNTMNRLSYDKKKGVYHDHNFVTGMPGPVDSLASYIAMWAGMVKPGGRQASEMVDALKHFEEAGGVAVTERWIQPEWERRKLQWARPNRFPSVSMLTADGLRRAGHPEAAKRISLKALGAMVLWYEMHGHTLEAYNAVDPFSRPADGLYPRQINFGWTAAEILEYIALYIEPYIPAAIGHGAVLLDGTKPPVDDSDKLVVVTA